MKIIKPQSIIIIFSIVFSGIGVFVLNHISNQYQLNKQIESDTKQSLQEIAYYLEGYAHLLYETSRKFQSCNFWTNDFDSETSYISARFITLDSNKIWHNLSRFSEHKNNASILKDKEAILFNLAFLLRESIEYYEVIQVHNRLCDIKHQIKYNPLNLTTDIFMQASLSANRLSDVPLDLNETFKKIKLLKEQMNTFHAQHLPNTLPIAWIEDNPMCT